MRPLTETNLVSGYLKVYSDTPPVPFAAIFAYTTLLNGSVELKGKYLMSSIAVTIRETTPKRWMTWIGWILALGPTFIIVLSATWKLTHNPWYVREFGRI